MNYYRVGHSSKAFCNVRDYVEKTIRSLLERRARKIERGFGWRKCWKRRKLMNQHFIQQIIFYQIKSSWSFSNYMVRNKEVIEKYINLIGATYVDRKSRYLITGIGFLDENLTYLLNLY